MNRNISLSLSGGGLRATLFGLGSLWRINDAGLLHALGRVTSVSGGSITAGLLAARWRDLEILEGRSPGFERLIADPVRDYCRRGLSYEVVVRGLLDPRSTAAERYETQYAERLFGKATLADLPDPGTDAAPEFVFFATSQQVGTGVQLSRAKIANDVLGEYPEPRLTLARAVAASSAFPPLLSPVFIETNPDAWRGGSQPSWQLAALRARLAVSDGGVYDNLGLESALGHGGIVLVSDAGSAFPRLERPLRFWPRQVIRVGAIARAHVEHLQRTAVVSRLEAGILEGAYWGLQTNIDDFGLSDPMTRDSDATRALAQTPLMRRVADEALQGRIINWAYALTDAALRRELRTNLPKGSWPVPAYPL